MTTEARPGADDRRATVVTKLPRTGSVLVRSASAPLVPGRRCVDVRPGRFAVFDGERRHSTVHVVSDGERRRFDAADVHAVEAAVATTLAAGSSGIVRLGDRSACRSVLAPATSAAIERRLIDAAARERATLLTWTSAAPGERDYRTYDVVVDRPGSRGA